MKIIGTEKEVLFMQDFFKELICDECIYQEECSNEAMMNCSDVINKKVQFELIK